MPGYGSWFRSECYHFYGSGGSGVFPSITKNGKLAGFLIAASWRGKGGRAKSAQSKISRTISGGKQDQQTPALVRAVCVWRSTWVTIVFIHPPCLA